MQRTDIIDVIFVGIKINSYESVGTKNNKNTKIEKNFSRNIIFILFPSNNNNYQLLKIVYYNDTSKF